MTVINPSSISGITSITMPSGDGNVLTIHTNDGTERFRIDSSGNVKVGTAATISPDGDLFVTGVCTATTLSGAASGLTGTLPALSAANLTSIPASNITGTLPALSAANLTSIPAANITGTLPAISAANLTNVPAANLTGTLPALSAASLTSIPAANIVGVATAGLTKTGGFGSLTLLSTTTVTSEVTTVTIENSFDAYDLYLLIADRLSCTVDTRDLHAYIRDDNNITGDYSMKIYGTSIDYNYGDSQGTMRFQYNSIGNEVSGGHVQDDYYMFMYMGGFEANRTWRAWGQTCYGDGSDPGNVAGQSFAVRVMRSAAITGIRFYWQSGDFRADSQFKLYGVG